MSEGDTLFARLGAFLASHRLSPAPDHYAFAYEVLTRPDGMISRSVQELTEGGFRLTERDIERLGGSLSKRSVEGSTAQPPMTADEPTPLPAANEIGQETVERALAQLDDFVTTVQAMHVETNDFGRDLMRSADAIRELGPAAGLEEITRLTGAMIERVRRAETRLEQARRESDELKQALDEAHNSARTDPLTELPNRRAFDEAFARCAPGARVSVVICDIDHFKRVNDTFGHAVGDRVLRAVAQTLASECGCFVARYGGEEFALLFERHDAQAAADEVDRARRLLSLRRLRLRENGQPIGAISFSAGVALGCAEDGRAALMSRADAALYRAKDEGRARTCIAP